MPSNMTVATAYAVKQEILNANNGKPPTNSPEYDAAMEILNKAKQDQIKHAKDFVDTTDPKMKKGGKVKKYMGGGKVYTNQNKRYAHGGKVSGRKATYKY